MKRLLILILLILVPSLCFAQPAYRLVDDDGHELDINSDGTVSTSGGGGGSGSMTTAEHDDVQVGGADIVTLDFGAGLDISESPDTEINVSCEATSTTNVGCIEAATNTEIDTATSSILAVTPNELNDSDFGAKFIGAELFAYDTAVTTGTVGMIAVPEDMVTWELQDVLCAVHDQGVTGSTDVTVYTRNAGANTEMLSTDVTIGAEYYAQDETVNTSADDLALGDQILFNIIAIHSGTAPNGLTCTLEFRRP